MPYGSIVPGLIALSLATGSVLAQQALAAEAAPSVAGSFGGSGSDVVFDLADLGTRPIAVPAAVLRLADAAATEQQGAEAAPLSREALFGSVLSATPKPAYRLGGFFDGAAAYTYADPVHWSRAVGRLQLVGQGEVADTVKWKISGRVDGDLVYATSDFYLDPVKKNQRLDFFWGENYIDFSAGSWDFRLGAQQIVWGEVVGLFVADVVSAHDMREFLLP
ncbi:MAG: hypothetical protein ABI837_21345, partial [Acidobacteriota bacterium]